MIYSYYFNVILCILRNVDAKVLSNIFGVSTIYDVKDFNEVIFFFKINYNNLLQDMLYHNSKDFINERIYNLITELRS